MPVFSIGNEILYKNSKLYGNGGNVLVKDVSVQYTETIKASIWFTTIAGKENILNWENKRFSNTQPSRSFWLLHIQLMGGAPWPTK